MRTGTVSYKLEDLKKGVIIPIGFVGENDFTKVYFDAEEVYKKHPDAQVTAKVQPPKGSIYPVTVTKEGNTVIWQVKAADLAHKGNGEIQLTFTADTMVEKSYIARTDIKRSLAGNGTAPDPVQDWVDHAEDVLEEVEAAEIHQPIIGLDGYWYTWNQETGEYEKTNTKAQGEDGDPGQPGQDATPNLITVNYADLTFPVAKDTQCYHDGLLYYAKQDIQTAEDWTAAHWQQTTVEEQVGQLKNSIDGLIDDNSGYGGTENTWSADKLDGEFSSVRTDISAKYTKPADGIPSSDIDPSVLSGKMNKPSGNGTLNQVLRSNGDGTTFWGNDTNQAVIEAEVDAWLGTNITNPNSPPLDRALASSSAAAPADIVGGMQKALFAYEMSVTDNLFIFDKATAGYSLQNDGTIASTYKHDVTYFMPVTEGDTVYATQKSGSTRVNIATTSSTRFCFYDENLDFIQNSYIEDNTAVAPSGAKYVRFSCYNRLLVESNNCMISLNTVTGLSNDDYIKGYTLSDGFNEETKDIKEAISNINSAIGSTSLPTTAQTVTGAIAEHETDINGIKTTDIPAIEGNISNIDGNKVNLPLDSFDEPTYGTSGQILRTNGDGTTEWTTVGTPTQEQTASAVETYLEGHPEQTTTVQDRSVTKQKFAIGALGYVTPEMYGAVGDGVTDDSEALQAAINSQFPVYLLNSYVVTGIELLSKTVIYGSGKVIQKTGSTTAISAEEVNDVTIEGVTFETKTGNFATRYTGAFAFIECENIKIENIKCISNTDRNFEFHTCKDVHMSNILGYGSGCIATFYNTQYSGIHDAMIYGGDTANGHAIDFYADDEIIVYGVYCYNIIGEKAKGGLLQLTANQSIGSDILDYTVRSIKSNGGSVALKYDGVSKAVFQQCEVSNSDYAFTCGGSSTTQPNDVFITDCIIENISNNDVIGAVNTVKNLIIENSKFINCGIVSSGKCTGDLILKRNTIYATGSVSFGSTSSECSNIVFESNIIEGATSIVFPRNAIHNYYFVNNVIHTLIDTNSYLTFYVGEKFVFIGNMFTVTQMNNKFRVIIPTESESESVGILHYGNMVNSSMMEVAETGGSPYTEITYALATQSGE